MTRTRFVTISASLLALASLTGLALAVPSYQCWLGRAWLGFGLPDDLLYSDYCFGAAVSAWQIWLPLAMGPLVTLLPALPALARLRTLGRSRGWGLLGLLPGVNLLLYAWLALAPWPVRLSRPAKAYLLPAGLCLAAAWLYYCLLMYLPWLAAKS